MPKLPVLSGNELINALKRLGFKVLRQKGSHVSLQKDNQKRLYRSTNELAKDMLLGIPKQCGIDKEDLQRILKEE